MPKESEQNKPFVVTDRRRHTLDGEPRPDADPSPDREPPQPLAAATPEPTPFEPAVPHPEQIPTPEALNAVDGSDPYADPDLPPPLTDEQMREAKLAYETTADRLDTAIRAANPGMDRIPDMTFDGLVQSVYMTAIMQLGGSTPQGQQPRVDLMGARQSIDMLSVLEGRTKGNLSVPETQLLDSALFELRMAFLEVTQALARSSAAKAQQQGPSMMPGKPGGPSIVR